MSINIEIHHIEAALDIKAGYTLGLADAILIHAMARKLLAVMGAQPVVWASVASIDRSDVREVWPNGEQDKAGNLSIAPLFTAPPAPAVPLEVTDEMAMAFHRALTDSDIGSDDLDDIKIGLRGALCNHTAPPALPVSVPTYITSPTAALIDGILSDDDNSETAHTLRIFAKELKFWRAQPLYTAPPAPAPAVPESIAWGFKSLAEKFQCSPQQAQFIMVGWNACRAAMLIGGKS